MYICIIMYDIIEVSIKREVYIYSVCKKIGAFIRIYMLKKSYILRACILGQLFFIYGGRAS